jgi:spore maturation protein SpmA
MAPDKEAFLAKKARVVSLVIAGAMVLWIGAQWIGSKLGMTPRFALLLDLFALAAFVWALVVVYQIWRSRQQD